MSKAAMMRLRGGRFLALGRAGMDLYADPPGVAIEDAERFTTALGGSAANIAAGVAKLGGAVALITAVSDDAVGGFVRRQLHAYGVGTEYVRSVGGEARNSLAVVETREQPQSILYRNGAADLRLEPEHLAHVDWDRHAALIIAGTAFAVEPSRSAAFAALMRARSAGLALILDVDYRPYSWASAEEAAETLKRASHGCDIVVGNDEEFAVIAGGEGLEFARGLIGAPAEVVIYKKGAKGAFAFARDETFYTPTFPVKAIKPTGAGDAFLAAFVVSLAEGLDLRASAARGAAAAALVVTRVGCAPASPDKQELEIFLSAHPALQVIES